MIEQVLDRAPWHNPYLADVSALCQFDVDGVGSWWVEIERGDIRPHRGPAPRPPDLRVRGGKPIMDRLADGVASVVTAFIRGDVSIDGDRVLLNRLHGALRHHRRPPV